MTDHAGFQHPCPLPRSAETPLKLSLTGSDCPRQPSHSSKSSPEGRDLCSSFADHSLNACQVRVGQARAQWLFVSPGSHVSSSHPDHICRILDHRVNEEHYLLTKFHACLHSARCQRAQHSAEQPPILPQSVDPPRRFRRRFFLSTSRPTVA